MNTDTEYTTVAYFLHGELGHFTSMIKADSGVDPRPQPSKEQRESQGLNIGGVVAVASRPGNRDSKFWWECYEHSVAHAGCCNAKARDIVGGGFTLSAQDGGELAKPLADDIARVLRRSNESLIDACRDWEVTGWCNLECLPAQGGGLYQLNHIDSWTMWPALKLPLLIHRRGSMSGVIQYAQLGTRMPGVFQAVHFNNLHWWQNTYYGVPDAVPVLIQIATTWEALKHNREFFARRGGYRWLMLLKSPLNVGATVDAAGDAGLIKEINYQTKKVGRTSDTDLLSIPVGAREVTLHRLDADAKDMDFASLFKVFRDDILMAHNVPPLKAGIVESGALGGNVGQEQLRSYRDNVVAPKQARWNRLIEQIIREFWGVDVQFKFSPVEIDEVALLAQPVVALFNAQVLCRREARAMLGHADVDKGVEVWAAELERVGEFGPDALARLAEEAGRA